MHQPISVSISAGFQRFGKDHHLFDLDQVLLNKIFCKRGNDPIDFPVQQNSMESA
jgi:hypothetical protein